MPRSIDPTAMRQLEQMAAWRSFMQLAVDYYAMGRIATLNHRYSVAGNLLHHAVETLLKACLVTKQTLPQLKKLGHSLPSLWAAIIAIDPAISSSRRQRTIDSLDRFERIRYPDNAITEGAEILIAIEAPHPGIRLGSALRTMPKYTLILEDIDELWSAVFLATEANPDIFLAPHEPQIAEALTKRNRFALRHS